MGLTRDMKTRQNIFFFNNVVSKNNKDFHSIVIPDPKMYPVFQFNFGQSFGQSIGAGGPYITGLKDLKMFGVESP